MFRSIIAFCLVILSSQNFLRKVKEEDSLSICFPMSSSDKNSDGIDIICSENNCYGTIYNPKDNTFTQITVKCSRKGEKVAK